MERTATSASESTRLRVELRLSDRVLAARLGDRLADQGYQLVDDRPDSTGASEEDAPDVVVLDDRHDAWLRALSTTRATHPDAGLVVVFDHDDDETFLAAIAAGASGFCRSDASAEGIARTIDDVVRRGAGVPRDKVAPLIAHVRHGRGHAVTTAGGTVDVTDREWEILNLLMQRRSTREMAAELYVSVGTVRSHVSTLLKKIGAVDRDDAISMVQRGRPG